MANKTVEDIYGYAQDILKFEGEDIGLGGLEEDRTVEWVADLDKQLHEEIYALRMTLPDYRASHYGADAISGTQLTDPVSAADASLTVDDGDALPSSGVGAIYDGDSFDLFQYALNLNGSVSGIPVTGPGAINFDHEAALAVERLYPLPEDFGRMRPIKKTVSSMQAHDGVLVGGLGYAEVPSMPSGRTFSVYQNSDEEWFLWLPKGTSGQIQVFYDLDPNTIEDSEDEISFRSPHHWYHVWGLIALYRMTLDEEYEPVRERKEQAKVVSQIITKRSAGKRLMASTQFFGRMRL
jgi:hypothetical protein